MTLATKLAAVRKQLVLAGETLGPLLESIDAAGSRATEIKLLVEAEDLASELVARATSLREEVVALTSLGTRLLAAVRPLPATRAVRLRVGGKVFETTTRDLLSEPGSLFAVLVQSGTLQEEKMGEHFIDRSPKFFGPILEYLRQGCLDGAIPGVNVKDLSVSDQQELFADIVYYKLESLMHHVSRPAAAQLRFAGFANWEQDAERQSHQDQDAAMMDSASLAHPGSHAASLQEYMGQHILGLPACNCSDHAIAFTGTSGNMSHGSGARPVIPGRSTVPSQYCGKFGVPPGGRLDYTKPTEGYFWQHTMSTICVIEDG